MKIWEPKPPGTLWATLGLLRDSFTFYLYLISIIVVVVPMADGGEVIIARASQ